VRCIKGLIHSLTAIIHSPQVMIHSLIAVIHSPQVMIHSLIAVINSLQAMIHTNSNYPFTTRGRIHAFNLNNDLIITSSNQLWSLITSNEYKLAITQRQWLIWKFTYNSHYLSLDLNHAGKHMFKKILFCKYSFLYSFFFSGGVLPSLLSGKIGQI
jgi:hypothetical protein